MTIMQTANPLGEEMTAALTRAVEFHRGGDVQAAMDIYRHVLNAIPDHAETLGLMASALKQMGRLDEALDLYDRLAATNPPKADFWYNRGNALTAARRLEEALSSYERALSIDPASAQVIVNLAIALGKLERLDEAEAAYRRALEIEPTHRIALHNLGNLLADRGQADEGIALLRKTTVLWPDVAEGHYNLGLALLRQGDFATGFVAYEWRWQTSEFAERPKYKDVPYWQGEKLAGKRLLVHAEQGLGDTIQFSKMLGLLASLGGDIVFHVPEKLATLMSSLPFPIRVTGTHRASDADYQTALLSLPRLLKLTLGAVPKLTAHLSPPQPAVSAWAARLGDDGRKRLGLVWKGNPNSPAERGRSLSSPEALAPFAALEGVRLIALQKLDQDEIEPADTLTGWRVKGASFTLEHPGPDMDCGPDAFVDTAAVMQNLHLVTSVCTAPLHLAGALGRPAIALLRAVPDWRWLMHVEDTPWYPTMRLERQRLGEDYQPVIARAVDRARAMLTSS